MKITPKRVVIFILRVLVVMLICVLISIRNGPPTGSQPPCKLGVDCRVGTAPDWSEVGR